MKIRTSFTATVVFLLVSMVSLTFLPGSCFAESSNTLRIALLPIPDTLPVHVAEEKGFFKESGVNIKVINVASALERDQLMQSGQIDGMLNEMSTTASFNRDTVNLKVISVARYPIGSSPLFRILASPQSGIKSVSDLSGTPIAVSKNTIIEYVTCRLLTSKGLQGSKISTRSVPVIPERYQLLLSGQIKAANLPDPLAYSAIMRGAVEVTNDINYPGFSISVLSFNKKAIDSKPVTLKKFIKGWNMAAKAINQEPEKYRKVLLSKVRMPKNVHNSFSIPKFPVNEVPGEDQWNDVISWMMDKKILKKEVSYSSSVTTYFLNK